MLIYGAALSLLVGGFAYALSHRAAVDLDVLRDRNTLYRELDDGRIENVFSLRIINKDQHGHSFRMAARGLPHAQIDSDTPEPYVGPEEVKTVVVRVRIPGGEAHGGQDFSIAAESLDARHLTVTSRARFFAAP